MAKLIEQAGIFDLLLDKFKIAADESTGYYISDPTVDVFWIELVPFIRAVAPWSPKCAAWERIKVAMKDDPEAIKEVEKAEKRRLRDDFKTVLIQAMNYLLMQRTLVALIKRLGLPCEVELDPLPISKLLDFFPPDVLPYIDDLMCGVRSVLVDVTSVKQNKRSKKYHPDQLSLGIKDRRYSVVYGPGLLQILQIEKLLTPAQVKKHAILVNSYNNPRWRLITGTRAGNLVPSQPDNPVVKFIESRHLLFRRHVIGKPIKRLPRRGLHISPPIS
ncbi:MAG: hypothetical protein WC551_13430 [Patescibacteria group bacterium]